MLISMYQLYCDYKFIGLLKDAIRNTNPQYVNENMELELEYLPVSDEIAISSPYGELCFNGVEETEDAYCIEVYLERDGKRIRLEPLNIQFELLQSYNVPEYER